MNTTSGRPSGYEVRARAFTLSLFALAGCATTTPPLSVPPTPAPETAVVPPAPKPAPEDPAVHDRADAAVHAVAQRLEAIVMSCEKDWLEPTTACKADAFEPFATEYQAYYGEHRDPQAESGRSDSLTRLGGPTANVSQIAADLTRSCEDRCTKARLPVLRNAATEAAEKCFKTKGGDKAGDNVCRSFVKKLAATVRPAEAERWSDECFGICEDKRREVRERIAFEARRPKTRAEAAACRARCEREHAGSWCGTGVLECLGGCETKEKQRARERASTE